APVMIARDGTESDLPGGDLTVAPIGQTRAIRVSVEADILRACDLIDMPGSSDPNMAPDIWDALLPLAQGVIWCSPATQAWRQSEAAIWEDVPEALYDRALLLLTRFDKIRMSDDRKRLLARVRRETKGLFRGVYPVSLIQALQGEDDEENWRDSGMAAVLEAVADMLEEAGGTIVRGSADATEDDRVIPLRADRRPAEANTDAAPAPAVMPRRVTRGGGRTPRPRRASGDGSLI
ncbi:MAG: hypothetical protein AAF914_14275, partial [Pseudomonadota bacterium]